MLTRAISPGTTSRPPKQSERPLHRLQVELEGPGSRLAAVEEDVPPVSGGPRVMGGPLSSPVECRIGIRFGQEEARETLKSKNPVAQTNEPLARCWRTTSRP
jgi:hypothetical protein